MLKKCLFLTRVIQLAIRVSWHKLYSEPFAIHWNIITPDIVTIKSPIKLFLFPSKGPAAVSLLKFHPPFQLTTPIPQEYCDNGAAKTKRSSPMWSLYVSVWKRHWNKQVEGPTGGSFSLKMPPRPSGVSDRLSPGELASMMNDHLSTLYRPTKSWAYHVFMTNFCCFVLLSSSFEWNSKGWGLIIELVFMWRFEI